MANYIDGLNVFNPLLIECLIGYNSLRSNQSFDCLTSMGFLSQIKAGTVLPIYPTFIDKVDSEKILYYTLFHFYSLTGRIAQG